MLVTSYEAGRGLRLGIVGVLAQKGENLVTFDPDRQIIAVDGVSAMDVLSSFKEIEEIIREEIQVDISDSVRFYEIISEHQITTNKSPKKVLENLPGLSELSAKISGFIGVDVSPFGLRLGSRGKNPNQEEWMDIRVEPVIVKADSQYYVAVVYRSHDGK